MRAAVEYTREELIEICEASIVPEEKWNDRDSGLAHRQVGECWALLKAGCPFRVLKDVPRRMVTDDRTIWLEVRYRGFQSFELAGIDEEDDRFDSETCYLPTRKRLQEAAGEDWY